MLINTIDVVRLPDRAQIAAETVEITGGVGAYGYDLSMTLANPDHLNLVLPSESGPAEVEITINGFAWTFLIESHSQQRSFDGAQGLVRQVSVTGRSRTALLAAPYAPPRSAVSDEERQAVQLAVGELENTGFTLDYVGHNWLVPAGAWFYEGLTPLDAVVRVASASGAVVISHPADKTLRVVPRYPASPWNWSITTPAHVIVDDVILEESVSVRSVPRYDAVIVAGELEGKGVAVRVTREGEAGNLYAPQATDPLINTLSVAAELGRNILSDRGEQAAFDLTVPMFPASSAVGPHRVEPLELVEVQESSGNWVGLVLEVRVSVRRENGAVVVEQQVQLERHYEN